MTLSRLQDRDAAPKKTIGSVAERTRAGFGIVGELIKVQTFSTVEATDVKLAASKTALGLHLFLLFQTRSQFTTKTYPQEKQ